MSDNPQFNIPTYVKLLYVSHFMGVIYTKYYTDAFSNNFIYGSQTICEF